MTTKLKKSDHYLFVIMDMSDSFIQWELWHSGQRNMVLSKPSEHSSGIIKSV